MELTGKIKIIGHTQTFGKKGFKKREVVVVADEQFPETNTILVEFIQDKCELLDKYQVGQEVKIYINIRGRQWKNPEGVVKYFNSVQGWRIEDVVSSTEQSTATNPVANNLNATGELIETEDFPF